MLKQKNFWTSVVDFFREKNLQDKVSRQELLDSLYGENRLRETRRYRHLYQTVDTYRRYLTVAGYLQHVSNGVYKRVKKIPIGIAKNQVVREAYGGKEPFLKRVKREVRYRILITGGCGFIGHHFVEHFLKDTKWEIVVLDKLTYASGGFDRVRDIKAFDDKRVLFLTSDLTRPVPEGILQEVGNVDYILHMAAETHVDNSITDPEPFVMSNVVGTLHILNLARKINNLKAFVLFSTDEVFGPAPPGVSYKEWDRYNSTNPYSATKAGAEELTLSFMNTYRLPGFITHCMNVFGERQHPEKFIPLCVRKIIHEEEVIVHSDQTKTKSGSRYYIHARNVANAVYFLLNKFEQREKYNIVGEKEVTNLKLAQTIANILGKELKYKFVDFHSSRPGHDLRYSLDGTKMEKLGWRIPLTFEESLESTVKWIAERNFWGDI